MGAAIVREPTDLTKVPLGELKAACWAALVGFEKYSFTVSDIWDNLHEFEWALDDLKACRDCQAADVLRDCKTRQGYGMWIGLSKTACAMYGRPVFAGHRCRGPLYRRQEIAAAMHSDRTDAPSKAEGEPDGAKGMKQGGDHYNNVIKPWIERWNKLDLEASQRQTGALGEGGQSS